jgi:hypothetical protein
VTEHDQMRGFSPRCRQARSRQRFCTKGHGQIDRV